MKKLTCLIVVAGALIGTEFVFAAKSKCKFSQNSVDDSTGAKLIQTDWDAVITTFAGGESEAYGSVSVLFQGEQKYVALKMNAFDYYPLPEQFAVHKDPTWDPAHRDFLDSLLGDAVVFPEGSSLRLSLDDQTTLELKRANHLRVRTNYAKPGQVPGDLTGEQKVAKGVLGFLAKKALDVDTSEEKASPHYTVTSRVILKYPIDAEAESILDKAAVTSMRVESRDRYYTMGWRSTMDQVFSWNKKSYFAVRDALQCVNTELGKGES